MSARIALVGFIACLSMSVAPGGVAEQPGKFSPEDRLNFDWLKAHTGRLQNSDLPLARAAALSGPFTSSDPVPGFEQAFSDLLNDPNLDAPVLWKLAYLCQRPAHREACESHRVYERLARSDPDNAAVYLWPRSWETVDDRQVAVITDKQILQAAAAQRFDSYFGRDAHLLYDLALELVTQHPHPDTFNAGGPAWQAYWLTSGMLVSDYQGHSPLFRRCKESVQSGPESLVEACSRVARLLKEENHTILSQTMGYALQRVMMMQNDPESTEALDLYRQQRIESKAWQCLYHDIWPNPLKDHDMTAAGLREQFRLLSELGEMGWYEQVADEDYRRNPQDWPRSPDECRGLRELEGEALIAELGELDPYDSWLKESEKIKAEMAAGGSDT